MESFTFPLPETEIDVSVDRDEKEEGEERGKSNLMEDRTPFDELSTTRGEK